MAAPATSRFTQTFPPSAGGILGLTSNLSGSQGKSHVPGLGGGDAVHGEPAGLVGGGGEGALHVDGGGGEGGGRSEVAGLMEVEAGEEKASLSVRTGVRVIIGEYGGDELDG